MADGTAIEWTDATWNPITGCSIVSPGCTNCYAMKLAGTRLKHTPSRKGLTVDSKAGPVWNGQVRLNEKWLDQPLRWTRPRRIFVCAHGDLFAEGVPDEWIDRVFAVMVLSPQHTFQVLTKRAARMRAYFSDIFADGGQFDRVVERMMFDPACQKRRWESVKDACELYGIPWRKPTCAEDWYPPSNVWLGVSAEDQARAEERIPDLLATPAAIRFVSAEPLLGPIDFTSICTGHYFIDALRGLKYHDAPEGVHSATEKCAKLDQIIVGGESGRDARPMHPDWPRWIRNDCAYAGTAFFFKQWGEFAPAFDKDLRPLRHHPWNGDDQRAVARGIATAQQATKRIGKRRAGRMLDGVEHSAFPELPEVPFR